MGQPHGDQTPAIRLTRLRQGQSQSSLTLPQRTDPLCKSLQGAHVCECMHVAHAACQESTQSLVRLWSQQSPYPNRRLPNETMRYSETTLSARQRGVCRRSYLGSEAFCHTRQLEELDQATHQPAMLSSLSTMLPPAEDRSHPRVQQNTGAHGQEPH
jgi:hypothetical protein